MKKILALVMSIFSSASHADNLSEFSTSLDFDELEIVINELASTDAELAQEISTIVGTFKSTSAIDDSRAFKLTSVNGRMELEREDESAVAIYVFTPAATTERIDEAFERASEALGI